VAGRRPRQATSIAWDSGESLGRRSSAGPLTGNAGSHGGGVRPPFRHLGRDAGLGFLVVHAKTRRGWRLGPRGVSRRDAEGRGGAEGKLPSRSREGLGVGAEPPRARMAPVPLEPTTNTSVQPRPAGGRPEAPPSNLDRVGQRGELGATVLGRAANR